MAVKKNDSSPHVSHFTDLVRYCLSRPPSQVGVRMRPERELAELFGVSRRKIRLALEDLLEENILVRRQGSGVYVRKIPPYVPLDDDTYRNFEFERLFLPPVQDVRLQLPGTHRALTFGFWWSRSFNNRTGALLLEGIIDHAKRMGHKVCLNNIHYSQDLDKNVKRVMEFLSCQAYDGHLVHGPFAAAFQQLGKKVQAPTIYVSAGNVWREYQPLIQSDVINAGTRAIRILANQGFKRIGVLGYRSDYVSRIRDRLYDIVLDDLGLPTGRHALCTTDEKDVRRAIKQLMDEKSPCDALYISDDTICGPVVKVLASMGYVFGENLGGITLSNRRGVVETTYAWSRMEFDPYNQGKLSLASLIRSVESAGEDVLSFSHQAVWCPGETHFIKDDLPLNLQNGRRGGDTVRK